MRPIGAIVIGMLGDRIGRKPAMIMSFSLAGAAVIGQALTPSYAAIGIAAPLLLLVFRMLLGFAIGGEVGPSTAYLVEAAPVERRGFYVSIQFATQDTAVLVAGIVGFVLASTLEPQALEDWGWRIAFLIGAVIIPFGIVMRRRLAETLHVASEPEATTVTADPSTVRRVAILGFLMLASASVGAYSLTYLTTYAQHTLKMATDLAFGATIATGVASIIFDLAGGWLSDKYGRKPVMVIAVVASLLSTIPAFMLLNAYPVLAVLFWVSFFLSVWNALGPAASLTAITESLPKSSRSGTLAIVYAFAISIFGGSTQFLATWLLHVTKDPLAPAYFMTVMLVVGVGAILAMPESAPVLRKLVREPAPAR
jgi:MFS family permease